MDIINTITYKYEFDGENYTADDTCTLSSIVVTPSVEVTKQGTPSELRIGDTASYRVDIVISDGDDLFGEQRLVDQLDENLEFVDGTLYIDGELAEVQDITCITVDFTPNSTHYITYQCVRIS